MNPQVITRQLLARLLPKRPHDSHKGMFGNVCVIGGDTGMVGAALLAARAALKLGAGCVHVGLLSEHAPAVDFAQPELMLHHADLLLPAPDPSAQARTDKPRERRVLLAGCGMGQGQSAQKLLRRALQDPAPLILDADALNLIATRPDLRNLAVSRKYPTVLTPHPGEAAQLLGCDTAEIQRNRIAATEQIAATFSCSVVLKGANSLIATRNGLFVNRTGNPGMSAPGMGDVLAGMIAAFIGQGLNTDDALLLAVHLHGSAGDELAKDSAIGMTASELIDRARLLLNQWTPKST